jgi:hypothetical protein
MLRSRESAQSKKFRRAAAIAFSYYYAHRLFPDHRGGAKGDRASSTGGSEMDKDYLVLKRASASRPSGKWNDDDFDILADGAVVGRILKVHAAPVEFAVKRPDPPRLSHDGSGLALGAGRKGRHD